MVLRLIFAVLVLLAVQTVRCGPPPASAACALVGKLCTPDGAQGNNPVCCAGLYCPGSGTSKDHCVSVHPSPSTTIVGPPAPTTTVVLPPLPPHPSTTLPPSRPTGPVRFVAGDVGAHFPASAEILWNPRTGLPSSQYEAMVRASTLDLVVLPDLLRLLRDVPSCASLAGPGLSGTIRDLVGKFMVVYTLRPLRAGDPYFWHPNYLWDIPQNLIRRAQGCVMASAQANAGRPELTPAMLQLLDLRVEAGRVVLGDLSYDPPAHVTTADRSHMTDGALDPRRPTRPLSATQCTLLHAAHAAHEAHAAALLDHDQVLADLLGPKVVATQLAFEGSARTPDELTLFALLFTGAIDPKRPQAEVDALTMETREFHGAWMEALGCETGRPPELAAVWAAALGHARAHFLRAITLPGLVLREVCPAYIGNCPVTGR